MSRFYKFKKVPGHEIATWICLRPLKYFWIERDMLTHVNRVNMVMHVTNYHDQLLGAVVL